MQKQPHRRNLDDPIARSVDSWPSQFDHNGDLIIPDSNENVAHRTGYHGHHVADILRIKCPEVS